MKKKRHAFVVCAYKESPYLEECILSLKAQKTNSDIIVITSTPCKYIEDIALKHELPYYVNEGQGGITQDWNFGYACARDSYQYITIAHQDDIYEPSYAYQAIRGLRKEKHPLIFFCDYFEIRNGNRVYKNRLLQIKRLMLIPLRPRICQSSRWIRRRILSFGSPICCPSVTFVVDRLPEIIFRNGYRACEDWEAWEMISKLKGNFVYSTQPLMGHRIHEDSETSSIINDNKRSDEEFEMFCKFWPKGIARLIGKFYAKGQNSNQL